MNFLAILGTLVLLVAGMQMGNGAGATIAAVTALAALLFGEWLAHRLITSSSLFNR